MNLPYRTVWQSYRELDRRIFGLAVARAVNTMGFSMVMPFMAMYIVDRGGKGVSYGGIYVISGIAAAVSQAVAGEWADRWGRRRVMLTGLLFRAVNMVALGAVVLVHAPLLALGSLIVVNGILRAMFEPAANASVTESCPPERRVAALALQRMGVNVGWALGPALGGALARVSYGALFFAAAALTVAAAWLVSRIQDAPRAPSSAAAPIEGEPRGRLASLRRSLRDNPRFFVYLGLVLLGATMTVQLFSTLSVYARHELGLSEARIGLVYTVNGVLVILLQLPAVALIDRAGPRRALVVGPIVYTVAYLFVGQATGFWSLAAAVALLTAGEVVFAPALGDMAAHLGDPRRLGRAFGLFGLMQQLGLSIGPLVGGLAFDHLRHQPMQMWGAIAAGMGLVGIGYAIFAARWRPT